jgi:hypothetical protein
MLMLDTCGNARAVNRIVYDLRLDSSFGGSVSRQDAKGTARAAEGKRGRKELLAAFFAFFDQRTQ